MTQFQSGADYMKMYNLIDNFTYKAATVGFSVCNNLIKMGLYDLGFAECWKTDDDIRSGKVINRYNIKESEKYDLDFMGDWFALPEITEFLKEKGITTKW